MNIINSTIGIWGLGATGASIIRFLQQNHATRLCVMDTRKLSSEEAALFAKQNIRYYSQSTIEDFFATVDHVILSPGVNIRLYPQYKDRCTSEVDLFYTHWHKPSIVITGTLGKTTITRAIAEILRSFNHHALAGGNVGTKDMRCLLDLLPDQSAVDCAVLELSSFQLEQSVKVSADIAIITNVYQNHLDYHDSMDNYFLAKWQCILKQTKNQHAIIPLALLEKARSLQPGRSFRIIAQQRPPASNIYPQDVVYFFDASRGIVRSYHRYDETVIVPAHQIPEISYRENWLTIAAALDTYGIAIPDLAHRAARLSLPEHRLHRIATINDIHFYNDSKSTIAEATIAAVHKIDSHSNILLFGGVSKGVDRTRHIATLASKVKHIICFGREAHDLYKACQHANISSQATINLEEAFKSAIAHATAGDHIIFSPGGASFDLFDNYNQRGERFIELVTSYEQHITSLTDS